MTINKTLEQIDSDLYWNNEGLKWRATEDVPSDSEWFVRIPEIRTILKEKQAEWLSLEKNLTTELGTNLINIKKVNSNSDRIIRRELLKHTLAKEILAVKSHLKRISNQLYQLQPHKKQENHITEEEIERARQFPIVVIVGEHLDLRRSGQNFCGLCPFHGEGHPSFYIFTKTNTFKCFGCQEGGDSIEFYKRINNVSFIETVKELNRR